MLAGGGVGGVCGSRISLRLRECDRRRHSLGFYSSTIARLSSCSWPLNFIPCSNRLNPRTLSSSSSDSVVYSDSPILSTCCFRSSRPEIDPLDECQLGKTFFGQEEDDRDVPSEGLSSVAGGVVALGKFDALHIGHRELAIQASKVGPPFLLSFVGMAEVLGWEPRPPIVAKCDRKRVLSSWAPYCGNMAPAEFQIEFSIVRHLSPREFVIKLSKDLGVRGVVAGENYRFGYKAAGDATELVRLCKEYGIGAYIINSVMDRNKLSMDIYSSNSKDRGQVSSTRVRRGLAVGDMKYVSELLGRRHRLILKAKNEEVFTCDNQKLSAPKSCLLNLAPKEGLYEKCYIFVGEELVQCRVVIDKGYIHIELDDVSESSNFGTQDLKLLRIEFGYSLS